MESVRRIQPKCRAQLGGPDTDLRTQREHGERRQVTLVLHSSLRFARLDHTDQAFHDDERRDRELLVGTLGKHPPNRPATATGILDGVDYETRVEVDQPQLARSAAR